MTFNVAKHLADYDDKSNFSFLFNFLHAFSMLDLHKYGKSFLSLKKEQKCKILTCWKNLVQNIAENQLLECNYTTCPTKLEYNATSKCSGEQALN